MKLKTKRKLEDISFRGESWLPFPKNPSYLVSNYGRVFYDFSCRLLKYPSTDLGLRAREHPGAGNTLTKTNFIVALTWIPIVEGKNHVINLDKNRLNNRVDNLRWADKKEYHEFWYGEYQPREVRMSEETKKKIADSKVGIKHPKVKGYYVVEGKLYWTTKQVAKEYKLFPMQVLRRANKMEGWKYVPFKDKADKLAFAEALEAGGDMGDWIARAGEVDSKVPEGTLGEQQKGGSYFLIEDKRYENMNQVMDEFGLTQEEVSRRVEDPAYMYWVFVEAEDNPSMVDILQEEQTIRAAVEASGREDLKEELRKIELEHPADVSIDEVAHARQYPLTPDNATEAPAKDDDQANTSDINNGDSPEQKDINIWDLI